jgi:hypothetical protein
MCASSVAHLLDTDLVVWAYFSVDILSYRIKYIYFNDYVHAKEPKFQPHCSQGTECNDTTEFLFERQGIFGQTLAELFWRDLATVKKSDDLKVGLGWRKAGNHHGPRIPTQRVLNNE